MEQEQAAAPLPEQRRASALTAVGVVAAIALLAAGSVVAWARLAGPAEAEPPGGTLTDELPAGLSDGRDFAEVPGEIAAAFQAPVVGAVRLDELPEGLAACGTDIGAFSEEPDLESAFITTDGATITMIGVSGDFAFPGPRGEGGDGGTARARATCDASWEGRWVIGISGIGPPEPADQGVNVTCCDADGLSTASGTIAVPEGAAWLVQDRGGYRLAFPVAGLPAVGVTWRYREGAFSGRPPSSPVTFLDDRGTILEERFLGF